MRPSLAKGWEATKLHQSCFQQFLFLARRREPGTSCPAFGTWQSQPFLALPRSASTFFRSRISFVRSFSGMDNTVLVRLGSFS